MQSQPSGYSQIFMTVIGLSLLVMALILNHTHPRNEGIASLTRKSIYQLQLNLTKGGASLVDTLSFQNTVKEPSLHNSKNDSSSVLASTTNIPSTAASIASTIPTDELSSNLSCDDIDAKYAKIADKSYDVSYKNYLKQLNSKSSRDDSPQSNSSSYSDYLASLASAYSDYKLAVISSNCSPTAAAPTPQNQ